MHINIDEKFAQNSLMLNCHPVKRVLSKQARAASRCDIAQKIQPRDGSECIYVNF